MATHPVTEFCIMHLKPDGGIDQQGTPAHQEWQDVVATMKKVGGARRVFFGRRVEKPEVGLLCVDWPSFATVQAFQASPAFKPFLGKFMAPLETASLHYAALGPTQDAVLRALAAPVTEVLTAYGAVLPDYLDGLRTFADSLGADPPKGYLGAAFGEVEQEIARDGGDGEKGKAVRFVAGWDSIQAHAEAKKDEGGSLSRNISLIREKRKEVELYHVSFKEQ